MKRKKKRIFSKSIDDEISLVCKKPTESLELIGKPAGSFCSLVNKFCKSENCGTCKALDDHVPNKLWVCTLCFDEQLHLIYPFWEITECNVCGNDVGVMMCVKVRKVRR